MFRLSVIAIPTALCAGAIWIPFSIPAWRSGGETRRTYEVYQPRIERFFVVNGATSDLPYNHCTTIAWFRDRWFCLWNANQLAAEGKPHQLIYGSTSRDGRAWSEAAPLFESPAHSVNPVPCPQGYQWQPNLAVVEGELWAVWNQSGRGDGMGAYVSKLTDPDGKWTHRRLEWDGSPNPGIEGKQWRIFPSQHPYRLRSGRVLAPATIAHQSKPAPDAPQNLKSWWTWEKRDTVLYTDDLGETWHVSPGCAFPGRSFASWEPTVWEQSDGTVMMFARNNDPRSVSEGGPNPAEFLTMSISRDSGATWEPHQYVPLETISSRMHVAALDGRGVWAPAGPEDDFTGRFYLMIHNDWPGTAMGRGRDNLALFFKRGDGFNFVPGPGLTAREQCVCYPHMWIHGDQLLISYSEGVDPARSPKVVHVSPLPDPDKYYLLPRTNFLPATLPEKVGNAYRFHRRQRLATRQPVDPGSEVFSFGAWVRSTQRGVIFDTRRAGASAGGFVFQLTSREDRRLCPTLHLHTKPHVFGPQLSLEIGQWQYVGFTADCRTGEAVFRVNGKSETVSFQVPIGAPLRGDTGHVGYKRPEASGVVGFAGDIRFAAVYPSVGFGTTEHNWLHNVFAAELGQPILAPATEPPVKPVVWMDPADAGAFAQDFELPPGDESGVESAVVDGRNVLRFIGRGSAGVDIDENNREKGDVVHLRFLFKIEKGDEHVLCTVGDANEPARVVARKDRLFLCAANNEVACGRVKPEGWTTLEIITAQEWTRAAVEGARTAQVSHRPRGTWVFLGQGYHLAGNPYLENRFLVDVDSVRTRVDRAAEDL